MRKAASILLLVILLFNFVGYRLLFYVAEKKADKQTEALLDRDMYDEKDLIRIEVPLSNPYQVTQSEFERIYGEIELDGIIYQYVKRKVSDGTLVLLCLPDKNKNPLRAAKKDFFSKTNDLDQNTDASKSGQSKAGIFKGLLSEYEQHLLHLHIDHCNGDCHQCVVLPVGNALLSPIIDSPEHPPDLI